MKITSRAAVFAAFGVGPLLLAAGCGGSTDGVGAEATLLEIQPTSFVELPPATTTTTTLAPVSTDPGRAPGEQDYTIRSGDTLGQIANRFDVTLDQLISYNQFADGANQLILPGDVIKIPPGGAVPGADTEVADSGDTTDSGGDSGDTADDDGDESASDGECPTTYTIKAGDNTRIGVAEQFGITFQQMDAANTGTPGYSSFVVGTEITIPCP